VSATVSSQASGLRSLRNTLDGEYRSRLSRSAKSALTLMIAGVALTVLVRHFDAPLVLFGLSALIAGTVLLLRPVYATVAVAFLLYTNLPVLAYRYHGVPKPVAGAFMLLLLFPLLNHLIIRNERLKYDLTFILMLAFLAILLLTSIGVPGPEIARERISTYILEGLLLYWLVINSVRHVSSLRAVLWTLVGAGALVGGLSIFQEVTGSFEQEFGGLAQRNYEYLMLRERLEADPDNAELRELVNSYTGGRSPRANGPLDEPNYFAQTLVMLLPLAVFLIRTASSRRLRMIAIVSALAVAGGVVVTYSRGAFVSVAGLAVIAVALRWIRPSHFLAGALALLLAFPFVAPDYLMQRVESLSRAVSVIESSRAREADVAVRGRVTQMIAALQAWRDHAVVGVGPGQYAPFYSVEYQQMDPRFKIKDIRVTRRAHSLYLEMAAELGVVGLSLFLAIVFSTMRNLWRCRQRMQAEDADAADLATAFLLSLLGFLSTAVFLSFSYERYLWFILAVSGAALSIAGGPRIAPASRGGREHALQAARATVLTMSSGSVTA
jgi:putative inorganic carbon (HCO3(-)) transporter